MVDTNLQASMIVSVCQHPRRAWQHSPSVSRQHYEQCERIHPPTWCPSCLSSPPVGRNHVRQEGIPALETNSTGTNTGTNTGISTQSQPQPQPQPQHFLTRSKTNSTPPQKSEEIRLPPPPLTVNTQDLDTDGIGQPRGGEESTEQDEPEGGSRKGAPIFTRGSCMTDLPSTF